MKPILDRFRLDGQVAVVTGSGRGIGSAIAVALAEAGAHVVVCARNLDELENTAAQVRAQGRRALVVKCDLLDPPQRVGLVEQILQEFGRLDILVNNAGGTGPSPTLATSDEDFEASFRFNVTTAFAMSKLCAPEMARSGGTGVIVNISSIAGGLAQSGFAAYGVAKAGLDRLTLNLAQDFAPAVRVNGIAVGPVMTSSLAAVMDSELEQLMLSQIPLKRIGEVEDIAACALFLASPAANFVTGQIYGVNGGLVKTPMEMPRAEL